MGVLCLFLSCYALFYAHSSFSIILKRKRKLAALLLLSCRCLATVNVLWLLLTVPWDGLQCVIVVLYFLNILTYFFITEKKHKSALAQFRLFSHELQI